jgi:hypothetical protein
MILRVRVPAGPDEKAEIAPAAHVHAHRSSWARAGEDSAPPQPFAVGPDLQFDGARALLVIVDSDIGLETRASAPEPVAEERRSVDAEPLLVRGAPEADGTAVERLRVIDKSYAVPVILMRRALISSMQGSSCLELED